VERARQEAQVISDEDAESCRQIGLHGLKLIEELAQSRAGRPVNVLTHCNAGALAFVDYGSALAPVYAAADRGIPVHVWVDETRPRNQGASLTAWELGQHGVAYDLIVDNAGGHLMQHGMVDLVITGADRVTRRGDAANKIGTYLKALAGRDNGVPFYVAFPSSTFDFTMSDGLAEIPIEERDAGEVRTVSGKTASGTVETVQICPDNAPARNWGFDVTPARCITGLITERGICRAAEEEILLLYPEGKIR
jgi:methylthioribose-1-phosphate isomerase